MLENTTARQSVVYLDSSDYSTLSDPARQSDALDECRSTLLALARSGDVRFAFSGTHLSEMAPLALQYTGSAAGRADMLVALCGRTALISFDRLLAAELGSLVSPEPLQVEAISADATWFPELGDLLDHVHAVAAMRASLSQLIQEGDFNHQQRRVIERRFLKGKGSARNLRTAMANVAAQTDLTELLRQYPMRPEDMRTLSRYITGAATREEGEQAFLESLRDPGWMMRWFTNHHAKLGPLSDWTRAPARQLSEKFNGIVAQTRRQIANLPSVSVKRALSDMWWRDLQDAVLLETANTLLAKYHPGAKPCEDAALVDNRCPGLATAIRVLTMSLRDALQDTPRPMKPSDVVDAMHAMYAPYVTVFRADRYMSPHIRSLVKVRGIAVVSCLEELPSHFTATVSVIQESARA